MLLLLFVSDVASDVLSDFCCGVPNIFCNISFASLYEIPIFFAKFFASCSGLPVLTISVGFTFFLLLVFDELNIDEFLLHDELEELELLHYELDEPHEELFN